MRALVLVDLDNLVPHPKEPVPPPPQWSPVPPGPLRGAERDEVVVAFAMNTSTAQRVDLPWLQEAARVLQQQLSPAGSLAPLELGLVLVMPETADDLLLRLLQRTADASNAGSFQRAWVLSNDKGLRARLARHLAVQSPEVRGVLTRLNAAFVRELEPPQGSASAATSSPPSPSPVSASPLSRPVDTPPRCAWASQQGVQFCAQQEQAQGYEQTTGPQPTQGQGERQAQVEGQAQGNAKGGGHVQLADVALAMDLEPWLASQLGPTQRSLRGLPRLTALLDGRASTLGCAPEDGVEVVTADPDGAWMPPRPPDSVDPSSLGAGAWVATWQREDVRALLRSRLPWWFARAVARAMASSATAGLSLPRGLAGVVDDATALLVVRALGVEEQPSLQVKLSRRGPEPRVAAEMIGNEDAWWWVFVEDDLRCTRKVSIPAVPHHPLEIELPDVIDACLARVRHRLGPMLIAASTVLPGATVRPRRRIAANQIGLALSDASERCGLLALGAPVVAEVEVVPIQMIRPVVLQAASQGVLGPEQCQLLGLLPLVVPLAPLLVVSGGLQIPCQNDL